MLPDPTSLETDFVHRVYTISISYIKCLSVEQTLVLFTIEKQSVVLMTHVHCD